MDTTEDIRKKLAIFEEKIMARVEAQCAAIAKETEDYRGQELEKYLSGIMGEAQRYLTEELGDIHTAAAKEIYAKKVAFKKELFDRRDGYAAEVFAEARAQLEGFVAGPDYPAFLRRAAEKLGRSYGGEEAVTLLVRPADLTRGAEIKAAFGGNCAVESSAEIVLGGMILLCPPKGYRVDESLDAALEGQHSWFYNESGLVVSL